MPADNSAPSRPTPVWLKWSCLLLTLFCSGDVRGTIVHFETSLGGFNVRLFNAATPLSVSNFLGYVTRGDYNTNNFIDRYVANFVMQGGSYFSSKPLESDVEVSVYNHSTITNEPGLSNTRGSLACAKLSGQPHSASSEWFINLADNSSTLDTLDGGMTVFGRVLGAGMSVVDAIGQIPRFNFGSPFNSLPLRDYVSSPAKGTNLVIFHVSLLSFIDGDYNFDGVVNQADLDVWQNSFGSRSNAAADGNGDGIVNQADYDVWFAHNGEGTGGVAGIKFIGLNKLANGSFQFSFTNAPGLNLSVIAATDTALPTANWTTLGPVTETSSGNYQFTDTTASGNAKRFYRVKQP